MKPLRDRIRECRSDAALSLARYRRYLRRGAPAIAALYRAEYVADRQRVEALEARQSHAMAPRGAR